MNSSVLRSRFAALGLIVAGACGEPPGESDGGPTAGSGGGTTGGGSSAGGTGGGSSNGGGVTGGGATSGGAAGGGATGGGVTGGGSVRLPDGGCNPSAFLRLAWPLPGLNGTNWVVQNYVDLDQATSGLRDWTGATTTAKTYDNHRGIDINIPSFREMDSDFPVVAAAPGIVTQVIDGFADRHIACVNDDANLVRVRQDDCSVAQYLHFKRNSIVVAPGQRIAVGQRLGTVGSSGCSTEAHLHFELNSSNGALEEPFATHRWMSAPPYSTTATLMDVYFRQGAYSMIDELKDPGANPTRLAGGAVAVASNVANGRVGDVISMRILAPNGTAAATGSTTFSQEWRHSWWWWNRNLPAVSGMWTIEVRVNNGTPTTQRFSMQ